MISQFNKKRNHKNMIINSTLLKQPKLFLKIYNLNKKRNEN